MTTKNGKIKHDSASCPMPENIRTNTQLTPDDIPGSPKKGRTGIVAEQQVEQDVTLINPDADSMESRG